MSPAKTIKIKYNSSLRRLQLDHESNIFKIDIDLLNRYFLEVEYVKSVYSVIPTLPSRCNWSDVASSSDDSSDESNDKQSEHSRTHPLCIDPQSAGSTSGSKSPSNKKESSNDKQSEHSKTKTNDPNGTSCYEHTDEDRPNNQKPREENKTLKSVCSPIFSHKETPEMVSNTRIEKGHSENKSKDLSDSANIEAVSERLINTLSLGNHRQCFPGKEDISSFVAKNVCVTNLKQPPHVKSQKFFKHFKENSVDLSNCSETSKTAQIRLNKCKSKADICNGEFGRNDHTNESRTSGKKRRLKNKFKTPQSFRPKKSQEIDSDTEFAALTRALLKNRMNHEGSNVNTQVVGLYCKFCNFSEYSCVEGLSHFRDSGHHLNDKINTISNYYCHVCKLIICCEEMDSLKTDHSTSCLHLLMEKNISKESSISDQLTRVDILVILKFNCINIKRSVLVSYDQPADSSSGGEQTYGQPVTNSSKNYIGTNNVENPLASVWVFPLKMKPEKNDLNWVKFTGRSDSRSFNENLNVLRNYSGVKQCLVDWPSNAAYIQFKKRGDMHNPHGYVSKHMDKHNLQPVELDLLERTPGGISFGDCSALLGNRQRFMEMITLSANSIANEFISVEAKTRLIKLKTSIAMAIELDYPKCVVYEFGSRVSGLSSCNSDFDLFVDLTGRMYWGTSGVVDEQVYTMETTDHIRKIQKILKDKPDEFTDILAILTARVPILRLTHIPTDSHCDLSFRNGLCVENTKLISKYLSMNLKIRWVVIAVKYWAQICGITSSANFTTYSLIWLALFYMMKRNLIPPVAHLMNLKNNDQPLIQGWKYVTTDDIGMADISESEDQLLQGFFGYYAHFNFDESVICPRIGKTVPKNVIAKCLKNKIPDEIRDYVDYINQHSSSEANTFDVSECCVQDPFLLSHNITRQVKFPILKKFRKYCDIANIEMLLWNK